MGTFLRTSHSDIPKGTNKNVCKKSSDSVLKKRKGVPDDEERSDDPKRLCPVTSAINNDEKERRKTSRVRKRDSARLRYAVK